MLSLILGENSSSRLFQELRERRGLCYHVSSDVAMFEETGALEITLALEPDQRDLALETIRYSIGQSKIGFETTASHLFWAAETLLYHDRIVEPEEVRDAIRRVSPEDVARVAAATLPPERMAVAEIAPEE